VVLSTFALSRWTLKRESGEIGSIADDGLNSITLMQKSVKLSGSDRKGRVSFAVRKILFGLSNKKKLSDFKVAIFWPSRTDKDIVFAKIKKSLDLIEEFDPPRFARLQRHVKRIWVIGLPVNQAEWQQDLKACVLDRDYVKNASVETQKLAATMVHEATHARIASVGIAYTEALRARIEGLCVKSELWFAKRLPNGGSLIKDAEARLSIPTDFWSNTAFEDRDLEALRELGKTNWVIRSIVKPIAKLVARRRAKAAFDRSSSKAIVNTKEK
jgi:hypothetical protein